MDFFPTLDLQSSGPKKQGYGAYGLREFFKSFMASSDDESAAPMESTVKSEALAAAREQLDTNGFCLWPKGVQPERCRRGALQWTCGRCKLGQRSRNSSRE